MAVRCTTCDKDNPADALFCQGCGRRLELSCPACAAVNSRDANFCKKCGTRLTPDALAHRLRRCTRGIMPSLDK